MGRRIPLPGESVGLVLRCYWRKLGPIPSSQPTPSAVEKFLEDMSRGPDGKSVRLVEKVELVESTLNSGLQQRLIMPERPEVKVL